MIAETFWPPPAAFLTISGVRQATDGMARCTGVAVCDEEGRPARAFYQGQAAHFFYEFEILGDVGVPAGWLELSDATGRAVHGKSAFQSESPAPNSVSPGLRLRYHQVVHLDLSPGEYAFSLGLASTDRGSYAGYRHWQRSLTLWPGGSSAGEPGFERDRAARISQEQFDDLLQERCRLGEVGSIAVGFDPTGRVLHSGLVNLPGWSHLTIAGPEPPSARSVVSSDGSPPSSPTILHVTHWKAGSQWIYRILLECAPDQVVQPQLGIGHFLYWPLQPGKIYPTLYLTKQQFDRASIPEPCRTIVVIRDLRDTLVSFYFSRKLSHPVLNQRLVEWREALHAMELEDGLFFMMDELLPECARIQLSWLEAGQRLIHYEDLLERDLEILEPLLLEECELPVSRERFREVVLASRFERLTGGRARGQEDTAAHQRKGVAGDWRHYFSDRLKRAFKARYGGLLVATGYERDVSW